MPAEDPGVRWLLMSKDPSVRYLTLTRVLGTPLDSSNVKAVEQEIPRSPKIRALLSGQLRDGGFGVHPYQKWAGAHWRLVSLVELKIPRGNRRAVRATGDVLRWLLGPKHLNAIKSVNGLTRRCASQEGNALAVCSYLGMAEEPEVRTLADSLVDWQWPDGGWNCDKRPGANHSSFYESLVPLWGLLQYNHVTGDREAKRAAERASEFFLAHRLFRSHRNGKVIDREWLKFHYPLYWRYDILQALRVLAFANKVKDVRACQALDLVESKRSEDGRWSVEGCYWNMRRKVPIPGKGPVTSNVDLVDWGRHGPNEMITLNALAVLKAAGRLRM